MKLSFSSLPAEFERVEILAKVDMRVGMDDVGARIMTHLSDRIPPPRGAWDSTKHLATGRMTKAMLYDDSPRESGDTLEMDFGMNKNDPSSAYHWAHEMGWPDNHITAKLYFFKSVNAMTKELKNSPGKYFRRNKQVI